MSKPITKPDCTRAKLAAKWLRAPQAQRAALTPEIEEAWAKSIDKIVKEVEPND